MKLPKDIKISNFCLGSYPCKHDVCIGEEHETMTGFEIYKLLNENNIKVNHFEVYSTQNRLEGAMKKMNKWK